MHLLSLVLLAGGALNALADEVKIPVGQQGSMEHILPHNGERKTKVLNHFGLPDKEYPKIGRPPITRWDYRDFSVYFEYDRVISSVLHHQPQPAPTQTDGAPQDPAQGATQ